ncbi:HD domain-containing protein [Candidatus Micrarchaeota archaeon]|nr:HD domain-containing protein [Candidatus Micrarchaeota archaeon]
MKNGYIKDFDNGMKVDTLFSVKYKHGIRNYANGYMFDIGVADKTGEIEVSYWGGNDIGQVEKVFNSFSKNDVVHIKGVVSEWRNKKKIDVNPPDGVIEQVMKYDIEDFVAKTDKNIDDMFNEFMKYVDSVHDTHLNQLLHSFFDDQEFADIFKKSSAAMYLHQPYIGGLLEHTLNVVKVCEVAYSLYPVMDHDLLITGALLHDIGKIKEFEMSTNIRVSEQGMLLGHVTLGASMILEKIDKIPGFPETLKLKLVHIILSHHGSGDFGSPRKPMLPEAVAVYFADDMDSKLYQYIKLREDGRKTSDDFRTYNKYVGEIYLK